MSNFKLFIIQQVIVKLLSFYHIYKNTYKLALKALDLVRWQGARGLESGAYTPVREHFQSPRNAASGQEMKLLKTV